MKFLIITIFCTNQITAMQITMTEQTFNRATLRTFTDQSFGQSNDISYGIQDNAGNNHSFHTNVKLHGFTEMTQKAIELERDGAIPRSLTNHLLRTYYEENLHPPRENCIAKHHYFTYLYFARKLNLDASTTKNDSCPCEKKE